MTKSGKVLQSGESGQEVAKQGRTGSWRKAAASKFSSTYWEARVYRPFYTRDGERFEVAAFYVRIKQGSRREQVPLATNNIEEAGRRAAKLFTTLRQEGWEAAFRLFRPDSEQLKDKTLTIGRYLELVDQYAPLSPITLSNYAYAIRRIASEVANVRLGKDVNRFNPAGPWRQAADSVPLEKLTPVAVADWRNQFLKANRGDAIAEQRAARSFNHYLRNARALFSRRILKAMKEHGVKLPDPIPFAGVEMAPKTGSTRYRSQIDAGALLQSARTELFQADPDAYSVILLALGAGLRRSEIDGLEWSQVIKGKGIIRVSSTAQRRAKSEESEGDIHVDPSLFAELESTMRTGKTKFVVEPNTTHPKSKAAQVYRASETLTRVTDWLRAHGVTSSKPLHTLRKEFGSVVAAAGDIYQAQRQLRHAQISTTEEYYADARTRATMPIGDLLKPKGK